MQQVDALAASVNLATQLYRAARSADYMDVLFAQPLTSGMQEWPWSKPNSSNWLPW